MTRLRLIDWQYYPKWQLSWHKTQNDYGDYAWNEYWIIVGPLQTIWGGKPWCTHLRRSPEYIQGVQNILQEDLSSAEYTFTSR